MSIYFIQDFCQLRLGGMFKYISCLYFLRRWGCTMLKSTSKIHIIYIN
jgi:hypothetical protein